MILAPSSAPSIMTALSWRFAVATPPWSVLKGIINKSDVCRRAHALSAPAPVIWKFDSLDEVKGHAAQFGYPCIIKPDQTANFLHATSRRPWPRTTLNR